ncbi:hypothetical protein JX265_009239 [Neoarthrinium moseri]|uniref:WSC domain-containing protein n=1 Tax=Neoarthrinium moseri TaxID=1658444 RepID=A0A9P9WGT3_9PEZI|nr:hypothetical protein JX265_009239 [Neoarthrinium moseri]
MKSFLVLPIIAATAIATKQGPASEPILGVDTIHGCYSSIGELQRNGTSQFNTEGLCSTACIQKGSNVAATQGELCYCGDKYPPASTLVDDSKCTEPCPGFVSEACGGIKHFTVYNTGLKINVGSSSDASSSNKTSTTLPSSAPNASASATTSSPPSSSSTIVSTNGAVSQLTLGGLNVAVLGMVAMFLM